MTPQMLAQLAIDLETAADLVEAIDEIELRRMRGWTLQGWSYELVPWGVRFTHRNDDRNIRTDVTVQLSAPMPFRPVTTTRFTKEVDRDRAVQTVPCRP
jgi:hypothetical protein